MFLQCIEATKVVSTETVVQIDNFFECLHENNDVPLSASFTCFGHKWSLAIRQSGEEVTAEEKISVSLANLTKQGITIRWWINIDGISVSLRGDGGFDGWGNRKTTTFQPWGHLSGWERCWRSFERSEIFGSLKIGALVIKVHIELISLPTTPPFVPPNPTCKIIQGLFMDEEDADIVFEVGGQLFNDDATKKTKTSLVTRFPAHRLILRKSSSSTLAELCRPVGDKTTSPIRISDVSPEVFRYLLFHLYGGKVADDDMTSHAKDILDAADRYGVVDLKLAAEACLVESTAFNIENFLDLLLYADSKNCALLKEAAIDFMLANMDEVYRKISFTDAPGALLSDVLAALVRKGMVRMGMAEGLRGMRVDDLRRRAHMNGLDVDGSREMLIAALKEREKLIALLKGDSSDASESESDSDSESERDSEEESDEDL
jgi:hypothetical protein